jgi:hypothetical protein
MTLKFDDIENKLRELLKSGLYIDKESLFNLGVELGRQLNEHKIDNFRSIVWSDIEDRNLKVRAILDAENKIEQFIAKLVRLSILETIEETGSWSIERGGGYGLDMFSDEVVKNYNVQVSKCDMESDGGDFIVHFEVTDELARIFAKHNIYKGFTTVITNRSGSDEQQLYDTNDLPNYVQNINAHIRNGNNWELEQYEEFLLEVSKPFTFFIMKHFEKI